MLSERLREARRRAGLRQIDLAAAIGEYDHSVISAVENGRSSMRIEALVKAASALDVSTDYLLGLSEEPVSVPARDSAGRKTAKLPHVRDIRLARALNALIDHYGRLNEYGRIAFLNDLRKQFPSVPWEGQARLGSRTSAGA